MKKFIYLIIPLIFFASLEFCLRYLGFGNPVIYSISENNNYYPKSKQENVRYKGAKIKINQLGMRTNSDWSDFSNKKKIIFFGDSVTYGGSYVDNKDLFSQKVCDDFFRNALCGNYGVNGYNIKNIHLRIEDIDKKYYDKIIILVSSEIENSFSHFNNFPFYKKFDYFFFRASFEILNHFMFKYKIYNTYHDKWSENLTPKTENKHNSFKKLLNSIADDKEVIIFILPTMEDLMNMNKKNNILELLTFEKIQTINLFDNILQSNYKNLYFNNAHLNKKGHEHIAKIIYDYIK